LSQDQDAAGVGLGEVREETERNLATVAPQSLPQKSPFDGLSVAGKYSVISSSLIVCRKSTSQCTMRRSN
jgi:hypothetical protein